MNRLELGASFALSAVLLSLGCAGAADPAGPGRGNGSAGPRDARVASAARGLTAVISLAGTPVGSLREEVASGPGGAIETRTTSRLRFGRAGGVVEMSTASTTEESAAGELRRVAAEVLLSRQAQRVTATVEGARLRIRSSSGAAGAAAQERTIALDGPLLGPEGLRRRTAAELRRPGDSLEASIFVPELAGVHRVTRVLRGHERGAVRVIEERWRGVPVVRTLRVDRGGVLVVQREPGPFGEMEIRRASPAEVALAEAGGALPAAIYERTLVRSNVRLPSPRAIDRLRLRLTLTDDALGWPELDGETQRVSAREGKSVVLEIERDGVVRGSPGPAPAAEFLEPNAIIESADPEVVRLARTIGGAEPDPYRKALLLTEWVHRNMTFDLGVVMAPASEIARQRRGTCAGYATMLASLARASGIPSRYVGGFVYYLGIWGGHAWVEMWIDGRWRAFDAAAFAPGPADAARVAVMRDSLRGGAAPIHTAGMQVYGRLQIEVLAMHVDGVERPVPPPPATQVDGATWRSPGLGLALRAPAGYRFTVTDAVWPDSTLVALEGPDGARARLREEKRFPEREEADAARARLRAHGLSVGPSRRRLAGRRLYRAAGADRAGVAWIDGTQVFTLVVDGPRAARVLDGLLEQIALRPAP